MNKRYKDIYFMVYFTLNQDGLYTFFNAIACLKVITLKEFYIIND